MASHNPISGGKLIIVSAPSGAGKTTLVRHMLGQPELNLAFSVSATSRPKRNGETDGKDYFFITPDEFIAKVNNNEFLEWEEVYPGRFYGTLKTEVDKMLAQGQNVVFDVDVVGGLNIKKIYGNKALAIFIKAPSVEVLEQRLRARSTESEQTLSDRLGKAMLELSFEPQFDAVVVNDNLDIAQLDMMATVRTFIGQHQIKAE